ncbi:Metal-binding protein [Natranaeroarchaeum sulfidigenes]|uniref:Metal-binding protein n=2 Tax=Natranaeroarchaeum sulfidigenes TaxID=2784880 RepID=A0A897MXT9_9EURY|nr:Metal-binding protein [Natranaeroarchaeum sulfidigenes]
MATMVDPTSDLEEDVSEDDAPRCVVCDEPIVEDPAHRVRTWVEDGAVEHRHFCSESCEAEWESED